MMTVWIEEVQGMAGICIDDVHGLDPFLLTISIHVRDFVLLRVQELCPSSDDSSSGQQGGWCEKSWRKAEDLCLTFTDINKYLS